MLCVHVLYTESLAYIAIILRSFVYVWIYAS
jgi:hypothetical protein